MSETLKKGHITKKEKGAGEFQELYLEGIEFLQNLSGANWTDYNAHDPGVTILENLAYTLTNLSHKVSMPVRDLLAESKGEQLVSGDNGFFVPSEILTTNPIIKDDYRKLLVDRVKNVKNVWIKTHSELQGEGINDNTKANLKGLYHIYVELYDYDTDDKKRHDEEKRVKESIRQMYHMHRNLCEDLYEVTILDPLYLDMTLALTIDAAADGEEVFAQVYYLVNDYLTHEGKFESLWDLVGEDQSYSSIYQGPSLDNGFLKDKELQPKKNVIFLSEITKIIAVVPGVVSINAFEIKEDSAYKNAFVEKIKIKEHKFPRLRIPLTNDNLSFNTVDVQLRPNIREIKKQYSSINAAHYASFKTVAQSSTREPIPQGEILGMASYYPIREQFPPIYGIGKYGLPKAASKKRKAQAKQLKAYLLPFDQLMTNFLAQLTHLYTIYDPNESGLQTYFHQQLGDMPELKELIKRNTDNKKEEIEQWSDTLIALNKQYDQNAIKRLNQVADNILARYGEQFPTYVLQKINTSCFGKAQDDREFDKKLLSWKRELISNYGDLSYNRAKSFDYRAHHNHRDAFLEEAKTPILIDKISILLGVQYPKIKRISKLIEDHEIGFQMYSYEELNKLESGDRHIIKEVVHKLKGHVFASKKHNTDPTVILTEGMFSEAYQILPHTTKKSLFDLQLKTAEKRYKLYEAKSLSDAEKAQQYAIEILRKLDEKSEGIHLVEHLLLAPPVKGNHFGFSFVLTLNDGDEIPFKQVRLLSNNNRNRLVKSIQEQFLQGDELHFAHKGSVDNYWIEIRTIKGKVIARSEKHFKHHHQVREVIKNIEVNVKDVKLGNVIYYSYYKKEKIDESFFSFRMSFVLPSWPLRFQKDSFRRQFNNIVYEQAPIHIQYQSYWLDLHGIINFEDAYFKWRKALSKGNKEEVMHLAYDLIKKIKKYQQIDQ